MVPCASEEELLAYMEHALAPAERGRVDAHLADCGACRAVIATVAATLAVDEADGDAGLAPGTRLDRYVVGERLGAGGAGVVYAARDPELQRDVAIKLVRPLADAADNERLHQRLRREAQAMARLRHPNVVAVFDAGGWQDRLFIAMELVAGDTLQGWLAARRRSWREVVATFRAAGAGLAAAHAAGIIHRDFKPANVLVGGEGRVCVSDFGLAATGPEAPPDGAAEAGAEPWDLTRTGALVGTPRYMAPEQFLGRPVDARTDVFAFSVALFEALHGAPPFAGDGLPALRHAVCAGEVRVPPGGRRVPAWLGRVVARGLRPRPADRYPSMAALLVELGRDPGRTGRRLLLALGLAGAAAAAVLVARPAGGAPCAGGSEELARALGPARRDALRAGLLASGAPDAASVARRTLDALDAYGVRFTAARREACEATMVRGAQSPELLDVRMGCLGQQLRGLSALADLLAHADAATAAHALDAVLAFDRLPECAEPAALIGPVTPRREVRDHPDTATARLFLGQAQALAALARPREGIEAADAGLRAVRRQRYGTLEAELLRARATSQEIDGRYDEAAETLVEALGIAEEAHDDAGALRTATLMASIDGLDRADLPAAGRWARMAWSKLVRLGVPPSLEPEVRKILGNLAIERRQYAQAEIEIRRALAVSQRVAGPDTLEAVELLSALGGTLGELGRTEESIAAFRESIAISTRLFGPEHVNVTNPQQNLGVMLEDHGRYAEALPLLERALTIRRRALGERHPDTLRTQQNHASALAGVGRLDEAIAELRLVVAERAAVFGAQNDLTVNSTIMLARFLGRRGDVDAAARLYGEAFAHAQGSRRAATAARELAWLLLGHGRPAEALSWARRWLAPQAM